MLGSGNAFLNCLNSIILIGSSKDSLVVQPAASDGMSAKESRGNEDDHSVDADDADDVDDDNNNIPPGIELSCGNALQF